MRTLLSLLAVLLASCAASPSTPVAPEPPQQPVGAQAKEPGPKGVESAGAPASSLPLAPPPPAPTTAASGASAPALPIGAAAVLALTQGKIPDAARDLGSADEKVRKCIAQGKQQAKAGSLIVKITIATSGFSLNAEAKPTGDMGKDVATCAKAALRDHTWGKPEGGGVAAVAGTFEAKPSLLGPAQQQRK